MTLREEAEACQRAPGVPALMAFALAHRSRSAVLFLGFLWKVGMLPSPVRLQTASTPKFDEPPDLESSHGGAGFPSSDVGAVES